MLTVRHWLPALGLIGPLVGCAERPEEVEAATSSAGSPRVALLTIDTWRADHFSAEHTPNLWALAEQGQRFTNAWSPIGLTSPAHATMFTGVPPWEHGMEANNHHGYRLPADAQTVAEDYQAQGWYTAAWVSAWPAGPAGGLDQGFDAFSGVEAGERAGEETVAQALAEWVPADQAAFLWIHLYGPRGPYRGDGATDAERYAEEVRRADALLKPVLDRLVAEKARIVVASDHGEVLLEERCGRQHERSTHAVVLRVPLFVWAPDRPPSIEDRLVGLTEVKALLQGASVGSLPERTAWVAESGLCEAGCAPGCRPEGVLGRDRVVIDPAGRWVRRPGRGTFIEGEPEAAHKSMLDAIPPVRPPGEAPDAASLEALGYQAP